MNHSNNYKFKIIIFIQLNLYDLKSYNNHKKCNNIEVIPKYYLISSFSNTKEKII